MSTSRHSTSAYFISFFLITLLLSFLTGCGESEESSPMPDFDYEGSDPKAMEIADQVMEAIGGKKAWENTRYVAWNCLGKRLNVWDKWTGDIRVDSRASLILMNLNTMKGRAWKFTREITDPDELQRAIEYGYEAWLNDSYWIFLPFKLKDGGVTLKYLGEEQTSGGPMTDILSLTFKDVGVTPENKYHVFIDKESKLLVKWEYYMDASDEYPRFTMPWKNYRKYGNILLSDDLGTKKHTDVGVYEALPAWIFESPDHIDWKEINKEYH